MTHHKKHHIVIIGGGFAGVNLVEQFSDKDDFEITLVDKNNYNFFPPLLYQVATGYLETSNICYPFRKLFSGRKNFNFRMGSLEKVLQQENKVVLSTGELEYDILVFATGTETNYFGIESVQQSATPMKTVEDALYMRNSMLEKLEKASREKDPLERKKLLTVVVAGGGPTGVEISGMFAEMKKTVIPKDYPELIGSNGEIYLVDGLKSVLAPMSKKSQSYTYDTLLKMGVKIRLESTVKAYTDDVVHFADGKKIEAKTLIWAAGVTSSVFEGIEKERYGRGRRMLTNAFNKVEGTANIYAIGDTSIQTADPGFPDGHPQLAQVAIQQGRNLGKNLKLEAEGKPMKAFRYNDKGSMAIIGRNRAVADLPKPKIHFDGFVAWVAWLFIHLISLINNRNRIKTLYNWMVSYFTRDQSLRMIVKPVRENS
ncbi:FAD-dependent oxidoreductase [Pedobacter sp. HMWF019]|uniref:NAD(P)/FAD-dependent oxidoreductase n=1 Tax=Pedobacter sp. HMWF019 TaxID=2056856 RepID=UPI000D33D421|nr:NAD(P)/FAD-dependent oxidoreductase [Pedobacter sp. HMWF019]PTS96543.1 FAD-dependent oxidoreductase [Pedobacter sp. HMWF019]